MSGMKGDGTFQTIEELMASLTPEEKAGTKPKTKLDEVLARAKAERQPHKIKPRSDLDVIVIVKNGQITGGRTSG